MRKSTSRRTRLAGWIAGGLLATATASADVPGAIFAQGVLTNAGGPIPDGEYPLTFRLYAPGAATALWEETHVAVETHDGIFAVALGHKLALTSVVRQYGALELALQVGGEPELPRRPLESVPYAISAGVAADVACTGCIGAGQLAPGLLIDQSRVAFVDESNTFTQSQTLAGGLSVSALAEFDTNVNFRLHELENARFDVSAGPPAPCTPAVLALVYWDSTDGTLRVCDGKEYRQLLAACTPGQCVENPGITCASIKSAGASTGDGVYWIRPDPGAPAYQAMCDMTIDGGGWTRFNWVKAAFPSGADPLGQTLTECSVSDLVCRGRIPSGITAKDLLVKDLADGQFAAWHFDSANPTAAAARAALQNKATSFIQNGTVWAPFSHNGGEPHCGLGNCENTCDSFYYTSAGTSGQPAGVFGLQLDGDTGWGCAAFKLGATNVPTSDDYAFLNNSGIRDEFGELYFR